MGVAEIWRLGPKISRSLRDNNRVKGKDRVLVKIKVREGANSSNSNKQHNNRIWDHQDRCLYLQFLLNNNNSNNSK